MSIYEKAMVAYDGSSHSKKALTKAAELMAMDRTLQMHIVTVSSPPVVQHYGLYSAGFSKQLLEEYDEAAKQTLLEAEEFLTAHKDSCRFVRLQGNASQVIIEYASKQNVDLIILGSRGLGAFKGMLLGSVSQHVVTHADSHVLIVK